MISEPDGQPDSAERLAQSRAAIARWLGHESVRPGPQHAASVPELAARALLAATAARYPWALIAGAAIAGGLLVTKRSRRWGLRPSLLISLAAPLASELASRWMHQTLRVNPDPPPGTTPETVPRHRPPNPRDPSPKTRKP